MPNKERKEERQPKREYTNYNFDKLVDDALGLDNKNNNNNEKEMLESKIMKAVEHDLLKMMHNGEWAKISEFKYRMPHLREWVDELEYQYWYDHDQCMSQWK